jgi:hypothetical protein
METAQNNHDALRKQLWIQAFTAVAGTINCLSEDVAIRYADNALKAFDEAFPFVQPFDQAPSAPEPEEKPAKALSEAMRTLMEGLDSHEAFIIKAEKHWEDFFKKEFEKTKAPDESPSEWEYGTATDRGLTFHIRHNKISKQIQLHNRMTGGWDNITRDSRLVFMPYPEYIKIDTQKLTQ